MTAATAHQTAGPYWHLIDFPEWADLLRAGGPNEGIPGPRITLTGRITDGAGAAAPDAMVEIWQADAAGSYEPPFHGFGRCAADADGVFHFTTLRPGSVPGLGNASQAPHIVLAIFARGLMKHLVTRAYFAGEPRNAEDPLLAAAGPRAGTLIAKETAPGSWRLDIVLQGDGETVFLDV
ncbi:protocatechuate 3,4-dioxygenase alpha subunit [Humitalea rosea]|uniref:Protocatechuate 3,4-dioxygenase alpha subunit n=1 Tax=Humitalea rosea TaxID=990373 RepID=A0A2W7IKB9_9PROT|nr:protocatechuate 3,4-dioxygenase subunit alpha [Humitalea rosea]PZW39817.1 protocatechuate 3,4-dioxygenase alpha subunit [Humitalea rosea]